METCCPCTLLSFRNNKNEKIRNWSLLMKIISTTFYKQLICIPHTYSLNMQTTKSSQLWIRSKMLILLKIILNAFNVWQYHFSFKYLFCLFQLAPAVNFLCCQIRTFYWSLRIKRCTFDSWGNRCHLATHSSKRLNPLFGIILLCFDNT